MLYFTELTEYVQIKQLKILLCPCKFQLVVIINILGNKAYWSSGHHVWIIYIFFMAWHCVYGFRFQLFFFIACFNHLIWVLSINGWLVGTVSIDSYYKIMVIFVSKINLILCMLISFESYNVFTLSCCVRALFLWFLMNKWCVLIVYWVKFLDFGLRAYPLSGLCLYPLVALSGHPKSHCTMYINLSVLKWLQLYCVYHQHTYSAMCIFCY